MKSLSEFYKRINRSLKAWKRRNRNQTHTKIQIVAWYRYGELHIYNTSWRKRKENRQKKPLNSYFFLYIYPNDVKLSIIWGKYFKVTFPRIVMSYLFSLHKEEQLNETSLTYVYFKSWFIRLRSKCGRLNRLGRYKTPVQKIFYFFTKNYDLHNMVHINLHRKTLQNQF